MTKRIRRRTQGWVAGLAAAALVGAGVVLAPMAASGAMEDLPQAPAGAAVWTQVNPSRVTAGSQPGDIKWVQPRTDAPAGAKGWTVVYVSEVQPGKLQYVSGEIYVPTEESETPRDIVLWNHQTVGMADICAPSRNPLGNRIPAIQQLLADGHVVVASDYPGLGVSGPSWYMSGSPNARASLDIARAALNIESLHASNKVAAYGWSQGGQTSTWAAQLNKTYAPELDLVGATLIAPATNIKDLTLNSMTVTSLAGYVIATLPGIKAAYPDLEYGDFLTVEGLSQFPALADGCFDVWSSASGVKDPYQPDAMAEGGPWWTAMEDAQTYDRASFADIPLYTVQGSADTTVPAAMAKNDHELQCEAGGQSYYQEVERGTHISVVRVAAEVVPGWFADRFAGLPADDNCVDKVKPSVTLVSPASAGPFQKLQVKVDATDNRGLKQIVANIYRDGKLVKSTQTAVNGARSATHEATVTLPEGSYSIKYNARDRAGNLSSTGTTAFTIDTTAPTVTVKEGAPFTVYHGGEVSDSYNKVSFKLNDAGKIDKLTVNGTAKDLSDNVWSDLNGVKPGAFGAVQGENTLVVFDVAGNSTTVTFTLN